MRSTSDLDTQDVLEAAATKWNFLPFSPGLVGGHCVGVDPYSSHHRAERAGYHPGGHSLRSADRRHGPVDCPGDHQAPAAYGGGRNIAVLGVTFKENVPDFHNTRVADIAREPRAFGADVEISDPFADADALAAEFGIGSFRTNDYGRATPSSLPCRIKYIAMAAGLESAGPEERHGSGHRRSGVSRSTDNPLRAFTSGAYKERRSAAAAAARP